MNYLIDDYTNIKTKMTKRFMWFTEEFDSLDGRPIERRYFSLPSEVAVVIAKAILRKYEPEALTTNDTKGSDQ